MRDTDAHALAKRGGAEQPGVIKRATIRWQRNARKTMDQNPDYFVWWYTVKSVGLVAAIAAATYYAGKASSLPSRGRV